MEKIAEIQITIRIEGSDKFPAGFVTETIAVVERSVFLSELEELEAIFKELPEIPPLVFDACRHRMNGYQGSTLLISGVNTGSLIVVGICTALSYWLVEKTLGETIKEAYLQSDIHNRLKELLVRRIFQRTKKLTATVQNAIFKPVSDPTVRAEAKVSSINPLHIEITAQLKKWHMVPPINQVWAQN